MISKTVTYKDYNGVTRTETHYFHLNEAEIIDMEMSVHGGFIENLQTIIDAKDAVTLYKTVKDFIHKSYGVKDAEGRRFIKNQQVLDDFVQTEAYSKIFSELVKNDELASDFIVGILPDDFQEAIAKANAEKAKLAVVTNN